MTGRSEDRYREAKEKLLAALQHMGMSLVEWRPTLEAYEAEIQVGEERHKLRLRYPWVDDCDLERGHITPELLARLEQCRG